VKSRKGAKWMITNISSIASLHHPLSLLIFKRVNDLQAVDYIKNASRTLAIFIISAQKSHVVDIKN
jgi:predicted RNA-binding protein with PUA-like domain